jgi:hypothetical protein
MKILIVLLFLICSCVQTAIIVCPKASNIQTCTEETVRRKVRILDITTREYGIYEVKYQVKKDTLINDNK